METFFTDVDRINIYLNVALVVFLHQEPLQVSHLSDKAESLFAN